MKTPGAIFQVLGFLIVGVISSGDFVSEQHACDQSYELMKEAYYDEDWAACVEHGVTAVTQFKIYTIELVNCRQKCRNVKGRHNVDVFNTLYSASLLHTTCIAQCKPANHLLKYYSNYFEREPYDFIQICYYKVISYKK